MNTKYGEFTQRQCEDYKIYLHKSILRTLFLKENNDEYLNTYFLSLISEINGMGSICGYPSELITLVAILEGARLEALKENCNFKVYRKGILDSNALVERIF